LGSKIEQQMNPTKAVLCKFAKHPVLRYWRLFIDTSSSVIVGRSPNLDVEGSGVGLYCDTILRRDRESPYHRGER
jgi:hypothetical protein